MNKVDIHKKIVSLFISGVPGTEIGRQFNYSREWVRQVLLLYGLKRKDGGFHKKTIDENERKRIVHLNRYLKNYRCTKKELIEIIDGNTITNDARCRSFRCHYSNAKRRNIKFNLSFPEWHEIWKTSGKLDQRGVQKGKYVMARFGDVGAYEKSNVTIITQSQNHKDAWKYKKWKNGRKPLQ